MLEKKTLESIVNEITDNYNNEELFYLKSGHCMPNRDTIKHIINLLFVPRSRFHWHYLLPAA